MTSLHSTDATPAPEPQEVRRTGKPVVTSQMLTGPRDAAWRAQEANEQQRLLLFNASRDEDSLAEVLTGAIRRQEDGPTVVAKAMPYVRKLFGKNEEERQHEREIIGALDPLATQQHAAGLRSALTVKAAVRRLRGPLRVIDRSKRELVGHLEYVPACRAIDDVIRELAPDVLRGPGLRNELGKDRHDLLLDFATDGAGEGTR
jgi:hypothetical protein